MNAIKFEYQVRDQIHREFNLGGLTIKKMFGMMPEYHAIINELNKSGLKRYRELLEDAPENVKNSIYYRERLVNLKPVVENGILFLYNIS